MAPDTTTAEIVGLVTLQFISGGLFDDKPVDDYAVHLVRLTRIRDEGGDRA